MTKGTCTILSGICDFALQYLALKLNDALKSKSYQSVKIIYGQKDNCIHLYMCIYVLHM